jgi:hypothetical protein
MCAPTVELASELPALVPGPPEQPDIASNVATATQKGITRPTNRAVETSRRRPFRGCSVVLTVLAVDG